MFLPLPYLSSTMLIIIIIIIKIVYVMWDLL